MKSNTKLILTAVVLAVSSSTLSAQGLANKWDINGNTTTPGNFLGTVNNQPLNFRTNGIQRMKLNGSVTYNINGFNAARDGYLWLGPDAPVGTGTYYNNKGAFSMLHLNGTTTLAAIELGYRPWMKTGVTFTENSDLMYVGRKSSGTNPATADQTDAVISWSDDGAGPPFFGPDNLRFLFTFGNAAGTSAPNGDLTGGGMDGREVLRMTAIGNVGVGPRFNNTNQPQSTYHQHQENSLSSWMQITNQHLNAAASNNGPTAIGPDNGLRWGILGSTNQLQNGNAFFYNQEDRHLIFSTGAATPVGVNNTLERFRITAIENPTALPTGGYGIYNPANLPVNYTRISISHSPTNPVTRPMSLLHLGYNVGGSSLTPGSTDGWRPWMDIGTFISNGTDNMYIGLKEDAGTDRLDAVVSWGDNQTNGLPNPFINGPDNLRFIFTATTTGAGSTAPANGVNGLESMRMTPTPANGVFTGVGGAPGVNPYVGGDSPSNTLEVNSWGTTANPGGSSGLRFTNLNTTSPDIANPGAGVLSVDANGDVIYVTSTSGAGTVIGAHNGTSMSTITQDFVSFGQDIAQPGNPGQLLNDREVPMNNFDIQFNGLGSAGNNIMSLGAPNPFPNFSSKFFSLNDWERTSGFFLTDGTNITNAYIPTGPIGVTGIVGNLNTDLATGVYGFVDASNSTHISQIHGVFGRTSGIAGGINMGVRGEAITIGSINYGGFFEASGASTLNFGIYSRALPSGGATPPLGPNYAGYFNGDVYISGTYGPSDANLKQNIDSIANALSIINQLKPKSFDFRHNDFPSMNFPQGTQYGLIAQEVEQILPELVNMNTQPATYDTLGNIVTPAVNFKGLEYQQLIPFLIKGIQEQQSQIQSKDSAINSLNDRLTALENCINGLNLCGNNQAMQQNYLNNQNSSITNIELKDAQSIVLEQNVPNPFAEQTSINYFLPDEVNKAQLLFYNAQGKLIQSLELTQKGKGSVNVFASDLSNGIYTYTLVVDGKVIETKKMVKN